MAANPQTKPTDLDCESTRKKWHLPSTSTIAILLLLSPRADTHFAVSRREEGWVDLGTAVRVCSPCLRPYIAVAVVITTTARGEIWTWVLSHYSQACYHNTITPLWHCIQINVLQQSIPTVTKELHGMTQLILHTTAKRFLTNKKQRLGTEKTRTQQ